MTTLSLRLSPELDARLTAECRVADVPKSLLAREALEEYLARRRRERLLAELTRAAASLDANASASLAAEALPLDNESLDHALDHGLDRGLDRGKGA